MEKTLTIDGKQVRFKSTGGTLRRYRNQFGKDFFSDISELAPLMEQKQNGNELGYEALRHINFEVFENIAWVLAKTADDSIPDVDTWLDGFDEFPVEDILPSLMELIQGSLERNKKK